MNSRDKAQALMVAYGKHVGKMDMAHHNFDKNNDRSFGDFGFHYFPETDTLQARVLITQSDLADYPDRIAYVRQTEAGLNDPTISGMFDRAGGYFKQNEKHDDYLVRDFKLSQVDEAALIKDVDALNGIAGIWVMKWYAIVAVISQGHMPKPTQRVDQAHDPYPRDWQQTMVKP